jgi:hypothetical protein
MTTTTANITENMNTTSSTTITNNNVDDDEDTTKSLEANITDADTTVVPPTTSPTVVADTTNATATTTTAAATTTTEATSSHTTSTNVVSSASSSSPQLSTTTNNSVVAGCNATNNIITKINHTISIADRCFADNVIFQNYFTTRQHHLSTDRWSLKPSQLVSSNIDDDDDNDEETQQHEGKRKVTLLVIFGDSLDLYMLTNVCTKVFNGQIDLLEPNIGQARKMKGPSQPFICNTARSNNQNTNDHDGIVLGIMTLHGMSYPCYNGGVLTLSDPRPFNTTADRIQSLLPTLLQRMKDYTVADEYNIIVQIGSNLWDLSEGCNNIGTVSSSYEEKYRIGIQANYESIQQAVHNSTPTSNAITPVFWKYAAPVSQKYSNQIEGKSGSWQGGRTQKNVASLNAILKDTIEITPAQPLDKQQQIQQQQGYQYGNGTVDWFKTVMENVPGPKVLNSEMPDGRHFISDCPYYVMFDLLIEQINQYYHYDTSSTSDTECPQ